MTIIYTQGFVKVDKYVADIGGHMMEDAQILGPYVEIPWYESLPIFSVLSYVILCALLWSDPQPKISTTSLNEEFL
jgi:hypothetical protein